MADGIAAEIEKKLGLPRLSKLIESFEKFPDAKQLKLLKEILDVAERLSNTAPDLDKVASLIREINSVPIDKLEKLEDLLKRVEGIVKSTPQELLDLLTKVKEE